MNGNVTATLNGDNTTTIAGGWDAVDGSPAGNINTFAPQFQAATAGQDVPFYFNVHSTTNPGGAVRGQIVAAPEPGSLLLAAVGALGLMARRRR